MINIYKKIKLSINLYNFNILYYLILCIIVSIIKYKNIFDTLVDFIEIIDYI